MKKRVFETQDLIETYWQINIFGHWFTIFHTQKEKIK
jgi:hypothetical protein